jgi:hypothetical protein
MTIEECGSLSLLLPLLAFFRLRVVCQELIFYFNKLNEREDGDLRGLYESCLISMKNHVLNLVCAEQSLFLFLCSCVQSPESIFIFVSWFLRHSGQ